MIQMSNSSHKSSFLVVGGGVVGLSLAWELSRRGQLVCLISSSQEALRSASWAGAGILPPVATQNIDDPYVQLRSISHALHHQWAELLLEATQIDTGFRKCGGLYLATTRAELATLVAGEYWWQDHGIEFQRLGLQSLRDLEPKLQGEQVDSLLGAWLLPGECQLRNPRHLKALQAACQLQGVRLVQATIQSVEQTGGQARLVDDHGQTWEAERICLCSGAWTRMLMEQAKLSNGIMPIRGQMLLYQCSEPPIKRVINDGNRYLVCREDGMLLAGSVEEEAGYQCVTTEQALSGIRQWAENTLPILRETPLIKSWAGLRPGSFDGLPYMGAAPGFDNLFIAAGHFRSGLHMSCGTAQVMADLMLGLPTEIDLTPFRVARG